MKLGIDMPATARFDVVGFGLNAVDHLCVVDEFPERDTKPRVREFARSPGGQAASAMVLCARLGLGTKYVGKVGGDEIGRFSLESLMSEGVDVSDVGVIDGASNQLAMIIVDRSTGERTILWHRPEEIATRPEEITAEKIACGRALLVDGHDAKAAARAARLAGEAGVPVVMDAESVKEGTADVVANTDVLIAARRFPERFTGRDSLDEAFAAIRSLGPRVVCATLGRLGAVLMNDLGWVYSSRSYDVEVVDTTGAGDVFHGAFVYGMLADWPIPRILDFANAAAALNCTELGARGGARSMDDIERLMLEQPRDSCILEPTGP
ncbi:MAG: ribokinase [Candidatus Eisenbacteria bacterium]|nr:ribokinase [Candidatus Eisenbacteria bacterium]